MSKVNLLVSKASNPSAGDRLFKGPEGPEILVIHIIKIDIRSIQMITFNLILSACV